MARTRTIGARAARSFLRLPGRIPIPGWFPIVVERIHPHVTPANGPVETGIDGFRMRLDLADYTQRRIYYGCHEPQELRLVTSLLRPGDVVLDVGAHVGLFALAAASSVGPTGQVHAFEPVPSTFASLTENARLNAFAHLQLTRAAVGAVSGTATLGLGEHTEAGSGGYTTGGSGSPVSVPLLALDGYAAEHLDGVPIRLLKIDVEGVEPEVLAGFARRLDSAPPDIVVVEVSRETLGLQGHRPSELFEGLSSRGYRLYRPGLLGRLRPFPAGAAAALEDAAEQRVEGEGVLGLVRQGLAERKSFFNLFALQPHV